jgi:hypothetical protein
MMDNFLAKMVWATFRASLSGHPGYKLFHALSAVKITGIKIEAISFLRGYKIVCNSNKKTREPLLFSECVMRK